MQAAWPQRYLQTSCPLIKSSWQMGQRMLKIISSLFSGVFKFCFSCRFVGGITFILAALSFREVLQDVLVRLVGVHVADRVEIIILYILGGAFLDELRRIAVLNTPEEEARVIW